MKIKMPLKCLLHWKRTVYAQIQPQTNWTMLWPRYISAIFGQGISLIWLCNVMSMWSLRWHFTNRSITGTPYSIKVTVCNTAGHYGEEYDDWNSILFKCANNVFCITKKQTMAPATTYYKSLSTRPRVGPGHPSSPLVHLLPHLFPLFTFPFLSLALPIFFFCPSLPFLPE